MFEVEKIIRFHHCHEVIEDWIESGINIGFTNLLKTRGLATPAVRLQTEYVARSSFGDRLRFRLGVRKLGNSSMALSICADLMGEERMRTELVVVMIDLATFRPVRIPDDIRTAMQRFVLEPGFE